MDFKLESKFKPSDDQEKAINDLIDNINSEKDKQVLLGVTGSGKTYVMANVVARLNRPTLVLSHNKTLAAQLYEEFKDFFPQNAVKYFVSYYDYYQPEAYIPGKDLYIEKEADINKEIEKFRMSAMNSALVRRDVLVVASVSCIYNIGDPTNFENRAITVKVGEKISPAQLARELTFMQYQRDLTDFIPGSFRIKGDIIEIYMPYEDNPIRLELWGDQIERISFVESLTGQRLSDLKEIEIFPSKNFVFDFPTINKAVEKISNEMSERVAFLNNIGRNLEAQRLEQRTMYDMEMLKEVGYCKGMENYSVYLENRNHGDPPFTLLDYFPKDYILMIDESHITVPQVGGMFNGDRARKETLIEYGFRLPSARDNRPLSFNEFQKRQGYTVYVSATPGEWEINDSNKNSVELLTRPTGLLDPQLEVRSTENQIDDVINEVNKTIKKGQRVLITTLTKRMAEDLSDHLKEFGIKVHYLHSGQDTVERVDVLRDLRLGEYDVLVGINLLREGIDLPEVSLVVILDADKEGFLRSKTSLVQTIGRAARHVEGRVILYADKVTESMSYAINETKRRREYQEGYNHQHGITPETIKKAIRDKLVEKKEEAEFDYNKWVEESKPPASEVRKIIKNLEEKMFVASENLQFEKAAELRDQIKELKNIL